MDEEARAPSLCGGLPFGGFLFDLPDVQPERLYDAAPVEGAVEADGVFHLWCYSWQPGFY